MKTKYTLLIILVLLSSKTIIAQPAPDTIWTKTFGGAGSDQALSVLETFDAGFIVVGATNSYGNGSLDGWLFKIDENGNESWNKTFGGSSNEVLYYVHQTTEGGYILAGFTESFGNGGRDLWLIKTDEYGDEIWNKTFGGTNDELGNFVQPTSDGGYIITGSTESFGSGSEDFWLIKVDGNGNEEWNKTYGGSFGERAYTVHQTNDNGYVLAGRTDSYGNGSLDAWLIKTDTSGNELWDKTFGGTAADNAYSLQITSDNGYVLAGYTKSSGSGEEDIWLIKTDNNGDEIWNKKIGGLGNDVTYSIQQTADSGYIISGFTNSSGNGGMDVWLIRTNTNGNILWDETFGGSLDDLAFSGQQTSDGGYIVAGSTYSFGNGQDDFYLIRVNSDGLTGIENIDSFSPENFLIMRNYPNPFNSATTIEYNLQKSSKVILKIYNTLGQEVRTLIDKFQSYGIKSVVWDGMDNSGKKVSSGVYVYRIQSEADDWPGKSKKLLILK